MFDILFTNERHTGHRGAEPGWKPPRTDFMASGNLVNNMLINISLLVFRRGKFRRFAYVDPLR